MPAPDRRPIAVVCDLTDAPDTAETRVAEYHRLFGAHLVGRSHGDGVVRFRFRADAGVEAWVRDLAAREQRCCGFFRFTVSVAGGAVVWDATVGDDDRAPGMQVLATSFGFKHGVPSDVDVVLDCRFLPNPHWVPELRPHTGLDTDVRDYVLGQPAAKEFLTKVDDLLGLLLPAYVEEGKAYLTIAVGCTGGRHRSVAIANELHERIEARGFLANIAHRDVQK